MTQRRFLKSRPGKIDSQLWTVQQSGNKVTTEWGVIDGAMQSTVQEFEGVNLGKANEKSPETVAQEFMARQILKKRDREGYRELRADGTVEEVVEESIDFSKPIPPHARFYKPQNSMNVGMEKLCAEGKAWYVRKRNGEMLVACRHSDGDWRLYSSKMLMCHKNEPGIPWADRYPHLIKALDQLNVPNNSILLGELVADPLEDDLLRVGSVTKALCEGALDRQKEAPLAYCIWDVAFWDGKNVAKIEGYRWRRDLITQALQFSTPSIFLTKAEKFVSLSIDAALAMAKENSWEGFVVIDPDVGYGDKALNFRGKAERPACCCKLKPTLEADFIVRWSPDEGIGERGKGKKMKGVGSVFAYLFDPATGKEVYVSKVGGGLSDENVFKFADPKLYPMVWQVEFAAWTDKGSLQFPQFVRVREDKEPRECTLDQRPEIEEE